MEEGGRKEIKIFLSMSNSVRKIFDSSFARVESFLQSSSHLEPDIKTTFSFCLFRSVPKAKVTTGPTGSPTRQSAKRTPRNVNRCTDTVFEEEAINVDVDRHIDCLTS